jgi:hypothetical protein
MTLFDEYRSSLKMVEVEEVLDLVFYRPLAFLFVKLIYRTDVTPNQLTVIAMLFGIAAGACLATGWPALYIPAAVLLILYITIDCADGQLARIKHNGTRVGRILDGISDYIVEITTYVGLATGLTIAGNPPFTVWILASAAGASNIIHAALLDYYRNMFLDNVLQRVSILDEDLEEFREEYHALMTQKGAHFQKLVLRMYFGYSSFQARLTTRPHTAPTQQRFAPDAYYKKHKLTVRLWTFLGTTTQMSYLIVCMLFHRFDVYFWGLIIVFNLFAFASYGMQLLANKSLQPIASSPS